MSFGQFLTLTTYIAIFVSLLLQGAAILDLAVCLLFAMLSWVCYRSKQCKTKVA